MLYLQYMQVQVHAGPAIDKDKKQHHKNNTGNNNTKLIHKH